MSQVRETHPGELAVVLSTVTADDVFGLPADAVEAVVVATQKVASWAHALQAVAVDRFAELTTDQLEVHAADLAQRAADRIGSAARSERAGRPVPIPEPDAVAASSLAPLLNIAPRTMRTRLNRARLLMELPRTLGLALAGHLEPWRVDGVVVAARDVGWERLTEYEARLYDTDVTRLPKPRLVDRARRAAGKADPEGTTRAHRAAPGRRGLRVAPSEVPGLMRWTADLPDDSSRSLFAAVDSLAQEYLTADSHTGARRSVEAARVDALTDLAMANATVETLVEIVLPAATAAPPTLVTRRDQLSVIRDHLGRPRPTREASGGGRGQPVAGPPPDATTTVDGSEAGPTIRSTETSPVLVDLTAVDPLLVDLVAGNHTRATLAAGQLERGLGLRLGEHLETAGNPFLRTIPPPRHRPPDTEGVHDSGGGGGTVGSPDTNGSHDTGGDQDTVWFVDGLLEAPGATALLPEHVVAILTDPATRLRVTSQEPGRADGSPARRRTYRPGAALVDRVRGRDGHCRFPGCSVPARRCQLDHLVPHPVGDTAEANLHCLCPAHHAFKHHAGWQVEMDEHGTCTWTAPTGRTHTTAPASRRDTAA